MEMDYLSNFFEVTASSQYLLGYLLGLAQNQENEWHFLFLQINNCEQRRDNGVEFE
jgi:hypothetical protein